MKIGWGLITNLRLFGFCFYVENVGVIRGHCRWLIAGSLSRKPRKGLEELGDRLYEGNQVEHWGWAYNFIFERQVVEITSRAPIDFLCSGSI